MLKTQTENKIFFVASTNLKDTLYRGKLSDTIHSIHSNTITRIADFSSFSTPGSYVVLIPGIGFSHIFRIDDNIMSDVGKACIKGFYFQRSDAPLPYEYAGKWHRSAGHADQEVFIHPSAASTERPAQTKLSSPGGWYDAGDYNKYIVNAGITMQTLLAAFEQYPAYFTNQPIHIPEGTNSIPDLLDEILYNLRWMLTMQDPFDGGVYHKCTNAAFDDMVMPGITKAPRYLVQKSTAATLDFAAVMAKSARIIELFDKKLPGLSDSCLNAAVKAWKWANTNPAIIYDQQKLNTQYKPEITTGAYGDGTLNDEWIWAAAEMFCTTSNEKYLDPLQGLDKINITLPTWNNVALLGFYALLTQKGSVPIRYEKEWQLMRKSLLQMADEYTAYASKSAFKVAMGRQKNDFVWGSNSVAANQGILLLHAYQLTGSRIYLEAAIDNADYLLGRNATGYCFVTGYGSRSPMHPHHRQSIADGIVDPVPGLLVGGPNPFRQDSCAYAKIERETAYTDDDCSFASNEIAINWNAPAVFLFNAIDALMLQKK